MRYYLGVDWADQTHAVWVVGEDGTKVAARTVPHTAEGFSEWGRELDEWRAQGSELWAARRVRQCSSLAANCSAYGWPMCVQERQRAASK